MSDPPRLEGPLPPAALDDPHLQPLAAHPERAQAVAALAMGVGILGFVAFAIVYWINASTQWEAATLGVGMLAFGFGVTAWGKYLMPQGPFVEERHAFHSTDAERDAMVAAVTQRGGLVVKRRKLLGGLLAAGSAVMGVALAFPLLRSLGPKPSKSLTDTEASLFATDWKRGARLVTVDGRVVKAYDLQVGGVLTVFPEGHEGSAPDQTILIRMANLGAGELYDLDPPGRSDWTAYGYVAYSKMCTHLGCPVGLYQEQTHQLVCPCHQSIFNVDAGAIPAFGPAPRPLPQLPLMVDANGTMRAAGTFNQPVGPGFWERP